MPAEPLPETTEALDNVPPPDGALVPLPEALADDLVEAPPEAPPVCASCGTARVGPFCHACGEKKLDRHDYAFLHFAENAVDTFTHLDVKVFKSLWSLLWRPGAMAADLLAGRRVAWAKPFQTFLIANLLFYLGSGALHLSFFDASLKIQLNNSNVQRIRWVAERKAAALGLTMEAYAEPYNHLSHTLSKTLVVLLVPVVAGLLALLFWRRRRYFLEHVTVATLLLSQFMLTSLLTIVGIGLPMALLGAPAGDTLYVPAVLLANTALFILAFRRVYPGRLAVTVGKGLVFTFLLMASVIYIFRPLLFLITNAST